MIHQPLLTCHSDAAFQNHQRNFSAIVASIALRRTVRQAMRRSKKDMTNRLPDLYDDLS